MSVGTGIFLGIAILAIVLLYVQTKDRWRWRSIAKWTALIIATPLVIGSLWLGYTNLASYLESQPKRITKYADISLGDAKADVLYAKGKPTMVLVDDPTDNLRTVVEFKDIPKDKTPLNYKYWVYESTETGRIHVDFSPDSQHVTQIFCHAAPVVATQACPALLGISGGETEEEVVKRLGTPSKVDITNDLSAVKTMYYSQWNVEFLLRQRRVYGLQVESTDALAAPKTVAPAPSAKSQ